MVQAAEATAEQTHAMSGEQAVCAVKANSGRGQGHKGRGGPGQLRDYANKRKKPTTECKFCSYEHAPKQCPAYGRECRKCGKMNHFQSKCKQHKYVKQVQAAVCDSEYNVGTLSVFSVGNRCRAMITLNLGGNGVPVQFQIDSGSECCVLPHNEYVKVTGDRSLAMPRPVKTVIVTYNGTREKSLGQCKLSVVRKGVKHRLVFNVLQGKYTPILSLDASEGMRVLKIKDSNPLDYVYNTHEAVQAKKLTACAVKAEYPDVFQGLGRLKDSYSIEIDESVRPVVHAPRRVPVPVGGKVRKKLDELECDGVLTPVTEATDWVSSMVIVQKPSGQIRICIDPKYLNTAIRREYYPMPTIE